MSIEITIYPPHASKRALREFLVAEGFTAATYLFPWTVEASHYFWFEETDYQSTTGVEATVYRPNEEESSSFGGGAWAVHTRTRAWASSFDRTKQNDVIRGIRKQFGGQFYNDWYGRNRYIKIDVDSRGPAGRGIWSVYERITAKVSDVKFALPDPIIKLDETNRAIARVVEEIDPARSLYNGLVPFAVAALEAFFSEVFIILLKYDVSARTKLANKKGRIDMVDVILVSEGKTTIEHIIAKDYSFQNVDSIRKAFNDWFGISGLLHVRKRVGGRVGYLDVLLDELIAARHDIIHRFQFDRSISKKNIEGVLDLVVAIMDSVVDFLELKRGIAIRN